MRTKEERFIKIYDQYFKLIYLYTLNRVSDRELAGDLTQNVFMTYLEKMDHVPEELAKPWLLFICKNEIIDCYRRTKIRRHYEAVRASDIELDICQEDSAESIVEQLVKGSLSMRIMERLREKNQSWYQIVESIAILELTQEEAARRLGMTLDVLRSKLYRARKFIRKEFGDGYRDL